MMRFSRGFAATAVFVLLAAPTVAPQSLVERLADVQFPLVIVTIAPNLVVFEAQQAGLAGSTASDLRKCIDNTNCPDAAIASAGRGDSDGQVDPDEVDAFESGVVLGLNFAPSEEVAALRDALRGLVTIDEEPPAKLQFVDIQFEQAEGAVTSTTTIKMSARVHAEFPDVGSGSTHSVSIARSESDLELAARITIQGASGWGISESSIEPASLRAYVVEGRISATQAQLEGVEPMTFEIEQRSDGVPGWVWFVAIPLIVLLAAVGVWYYAASQRRKG